MSNDHAHPTMRPILAHICPPARNSYGEPVNLSGPVCAHCKQRIGEGQPYRVDQPENLNRCRHCWLQERVQESDRREMMQHAGFVCDRRDWDHPDRRQTTIAGQDRVQGEPPELDDAENEPCPCGGDHLKRRHDLIAACDAGLRCSCVTILCPLHVNAQRLLDAAKELLNGHTLGMRSSAIKLRRELLQDAVAAAEGKV